MNIDSTPEDLQADALIAEIRQRTAAEVDRIRADAARQAGQVRERARDKARRQQRRAIAELRALGQQQLQRVQAELETQARRHDAAEAAAWLAAVEPRLRPALAERWRQPATRQRWIEALLALAAARLGNTAWTLRHPAGLTPNGAARGGDTWVADAAAVDGLLIEADGARLDGRADALLADRAAVQARVLAHLPAAGAAR